MRVYLAPQGLCASSLSMLRVTRALENHLPHGVQLTRDVKHADLVIAHVIGHDSVNISVPEGKRYAMIQYCLGTTSLSIDQWMPSWQNAKFVWSYYDLSAHLNGNFYHAPLGVDAVFTQDFDERPRMGVMTSGYVSHPSGEAIEEVAIAAFMLGMPLFHLGPAKVQGVGMELNSIHGISDGALASYYSQLKWVSGLRHIEGFELPVIEGLCCGARPIVFDREDMHQWYSGHAVFVPESTGQQLIRHLLDVLGEEPEFVSRDERQWARERFAWGPIARGFWERVL